MNTIASKIVSDANNIIETHGYSATIYASPTYSYDDEGKATITKGTGTSAKCLVFQDKKVVLTEESEGIDEVIQYIAYFKSNTSLNEKSVIYVNSEYYKVIEISNNPIESTAVTFFGVLIERIRDQTTIV